MRLGKLAATACALAALAGAAEARVTRQALVLEVERFGAQTMAQWQASPGMGVCVVRRGEQPIVTGFGFADLEAGRRVGEDTLFYYASYNKVWTALAILQLHARGLVDIDSPLSTLAPGITMPEPLSMDRLTLRQLLTHTSGVENAAIGIRTSFTGEHTPDEIWRLWSRYTTPSKRGDAFNYTNLGYVMGTYAIQRRTGADWRSLVEREVLTPLGVRSVTSRLDAENPPANIAMPYEYDGNTVRRAYLRKQTENIGAAGGYFSTVRDACRFVQMMIDGGRVNGRQIFDASVIRQMTSPQVKQDADYYQTRRSHYGFGWNIADYTGVRMAQAHGGFQGYRAHASLLLDEGMGVVAFTNENSPYGGNQPDYFANHMYDFMLERADLAKRDAERVAILASDRERAKQGLARMMSRVQIVQAFALPNEAYTGTYCSDELGTMVVSIRDGELYAKHGLAAGGPLRPGGGQLAWVYFAQPRIPSDRLTFVANDAGQVTGFRYSGIDFARSLGTGTCARQTH